MTKINEAQRRRIAGENLAKIGIRLDDQIVMRAHLDARFEKPCVVQGFLSNSPHISIGAYTGIFGAHIWGAHIGRFCSIADNARIGLSEHPTDWLTSSMIGYISNVHGWAQHRRDLGQAFGVEMSNFPTRPTTSIGNDVWIGYGAFIRSGLAIGDGAIIAGGAVVVSDVQPYSIVAGNPARQLRLRFPEHIVERMLRIKWWEWEILDLNLKMSEVERSLDAIEVAIQQGSIQRLSLTKESLRTAAME